MREHVQVALGESEVRIYLGTELVALHQRSFEPHARVLDPSHYAGLWRAPTAAEAPASQASVLASYGRSLHDYEAALTEVVQ